MRSNLFLIFFMLHSSCSFIGRAQPQTVEDDFEGSGTISAWIGDDCIIDPNLSNPFQQMPNTSATVMSYTDNGGAYANVRFNVSVAFDLSENQTFSVDIYMPSSEITGSQPHQISLKLQDGTLDSPLFTQCEIIKPLTTDQWQTVTFDFLNDDYINFEPNSPPPTQRSDFNRVLMQLNGENNSDQVVAFFDNFFYDGTLNGIPVFDVLVWSDEFDGVGAVDPTKWFHQTQLPEGGNWFNGELQHYTNRLVNSNVSSGKLFLIAKKETFTDQGFTKSYTSARLNSKFAFRYGRVEIKAKLPTGGGTWPALWMLGKNINEDGAYWDNQGFGNTPWPACGEIDIMEHWGFNQNYVQSATHTPSSFGATENYGGQTIPTASNEFHVYALEWTADHLIFSVDGNVHFTYDPPIKNAETWPFDAEQYLILNTAIESSVDPTFTLSAMEVDYVRVYQTSVVSVAESQLGQSIKAYPNPFENELTIELSHLTNDPVTVTVYSLEGKRLQTWMQGNIEKHLTLPLGHLKSGVYLISVEVGQTIYRVKVIKT